MKAKILVVEDNLLNQRLVRDILEHRGHEISVARTVASARKRLEAERPDLVLLDIQLPGGGGEKLLAEIRANPSLANLPVVAVTALAMDGDRERLLRLGFDGYVSKPINTRSFGSVIESFIKKKGASHER